MNTSKQFLEYQKQQPTILFSALNFDCSILQLIELMKFISKFKAKKNNATKFALFKKLSVFNFRFLEKNLTIKKITVA